MQRDLLLLHLRLLNYFFRDLALSGFVVNLLEVAMAAHVIRQWHAGTQIFASHEQLYLKCDLDVTVSFDVSSYFFELNFQYFRLLFQKNMELIILHVKENAPIYELPTLLDY